MAKSGLIFKSEEEFKKEYQPERMGEGALKQVIQQLRSHNMSAEGVKTKTLDAEPIIKDSKETKLKEDANKNTEHLLNENKKLNKNIEKLSKTIGDVTKGKGITGERAEKLAKDQEKDYRGIGQQFKERLTGRAGNKYDPSGMAWKFGSIRGLLHTTGLVKAGSGSFLDRKLDVREERLRTAQEMAKLNPQMKNLGPKGNKRFKTDADVEAYYAERGKNVQDAKANLQTEQYKIDTAQALMSEEEYARTTGGKRQLKARDEAAQALIDIDPTKTGEKKGAFKPAKEENIQDELNVSQEESDTLKALTASSEPINELIAITKVENERKTKADSDMLAALNNVAAAAGEGGSLGGLANAATNLVGRKGAIGAAKKGAGYLSKVGGAGKLMKGLGIGAVGALAGEGLQMGGEKLQEAGYEKTGKAVGAGGTAVKYAGYGAMIGSVIPGVGTAIGAGIGGAVGLGKGIYDNYYKGTPKTTKNKEAHSLRMDTSDPNNVRYLVDDKEISADEYMRLQNIEDLGDQAKAIAAASNKADQVSARSADNAVAKLPSNSAPATNIVNAPTTISKSSTNNAIKVPIRDQDNTVKSYHKSRYAT